MKRFVAVYDEAAVRDTQICKEDPNSVSPEMDDVWEDWPNAPMYIGLFAGVDEAGATKAACETESCDANCIRLIPVGDYDEEFHYLLKFAAGAEFRPSTCGPCGCPTASTRRSRWTCRSTPPNWRFCSTICRTTIPVSGGRASRSLPKSWASGCAESYKKVPAASAAGAFLFGRSHGPGIGFDTEPARATAFSEQNEPRRLFSVKKECLFPTVASMGSPIFFNEEIGRDDSSFQTSLAGAGSLAGTDVGSVKGSAVGNNNFGIPQTKRTPAASLPQGSSLDISRICSSSLPSELPHA